MRRLVHKHSATGRRRSLAARLVCLAMLGVIMLGRGAPAAPVRVTTVECRLVEGLWESWSDGKLTLSVEGKSTALGASELMSVHFLAAMTAPAPASRPADQVTVHLADASRFDGTILGSRNDHLQVRTDLVPELNLPLSSVAGVRFNTQENAAADEAFAQALTRRDSTQDTLFIVQDGKVSPLRGLLESLDAQSGSFKWRERSVRLDRSRAYGVVLARGAGTPASPQVRCVLTDASIWAGAVERADDRSMTLRLGAGPTVDLSLTRVTDLRFANTRVIFLSDLEPTRYEFVPWGTTRWPWRKDRSVADRELFIDNQPFDRGIGVHSQSTLTYTLTEPYQQFAATVGLDDAVGSRGSVVFRVTADGKEVFNSGLMKGGDAGKPVLVALNGAKTLQLLVDFGDELDVADQADWGAARLIK